MVLELTLKPSWTLFSDFFKDWSHSIESRWLPTRKELIKPDYQIIVFHQ